MAYLVVLLWLEEVPHGLHPLLQEAPPLALRGAGSRGKGRGRGEHTTYHGPSSNNLFSFTALQPFYTPPRRHGKGLVWLY